MRLKEKEGNYIEKRWLGWKRRKDNFFKTFLRRNFSSKSFLMNVAFKMCFWACEHSDLLLSEKWHYGEVIYLINVSIMCCSSSLKALLGATSPLMTVIEKISLHKGPLIINCCITRLRSSSLDVDAHLMISRWFVTLIFTLSRTVSRYSRQFGIQFNGCVETMKRVKEMSFNRNRRLTLTCLFRSKENISAFKLTKVSNRSLKCDQRPIPFRKSLSQWTRNIHVVMCIPGNSLCCNGKQSIWLERLATGNMIQGISLTRGKAL